MGLGIMDIVTGGGSSLVGGLTDMLGGDSGAGDASIRGAQIAADSQRESLDYLKELDAVPREYREGALGQMANIFGLGDDTGRADFFAGLKDDPLYQSILGTQGAREESYARNQAVTGLRGSDTSMGLGDIAQNTERDALMTAYNSQMQGLSGLSGLPSYGTEIASGISGIGQTLGQGQIAAAQAREDSKQAGISNLVGLGGIGAALFSDIRLKENIQQIGVIYGLPTYTWDWNDEAKGLGLSGSSEGFIAQEVEKLRPELVGESCGYKTVNYEGIVNG